MLLPDKLFKSSFVSIQHNAGYGFIVFRPNCFAKFNQYQVVQVCG